MDASLDNANNPFAISNGATTDNIISQKNDGLLLNLTDNFKQNGTDISPATDFFPKEKSNGKRSASEFDDDDFGPETDVDAVDDVLSPVETAKGFGDVFSNNNPAEGVCNPFIEHQEKASFEIERELQKQQSADMEEARLAREETPTPPADAVHDVSGLVETAAESDSEDEWNYIKGDDANKENISPQQEKEVAEVPEEDEAMSQLNPNAAEFIPVSPTRSVPSPACQRLLNDQVISQSPKRSDVPNEMDINLPNPVEFEKEVKSRPSEVDSYSNGHDESDNNKSPIDLMENLLNGRNIDEIPEFQPGSTPTKITPASDEFHFGPGAVPFTPSKFLDQSEAGLSTKAVFGDESSATIGTSFNESVASQDTAADLNILNKDSDPMSMSFYADGDGGNNPFDLNEVQVLPDNIDEFLNRPDNNFDDTISDLPEHYPLGEPRTVTINNDDAVQITDLDKQSYDDEKELASPLEPEKELSDALASGEECEQSKTPEPTHENLLGYDFCSVVDPSARDVEAISPEASSKLSETASSRPESSHENLKSPVLGDASEVPDLLQAPPTILPEDVEMISPELKLDTPETVTHEESLSKSPQPEAGEVDDLLGKEAKSPVPQASEIDDLLERPDSVQSKSPVPDIIETNLLQSEAKSPELEAESPVCERFGATESPICERPDSKSPVCEIPIAESPVCERPIAESPVCERPISKSPVCERPISESPVCERPISESPVCELPSAKSPVCERPISESPVCELPSAKSPVCERPIAESPVCERPVAESPVCELPATESPVCRRPIADSPVCERPIADSPVCERPIADSPVCERPIADSPVCERPIAESPVCELPVSESPVCQRPLSASPVCERPVSESPVCLLERVESPVCERPLSKSPVPEFQASESPVPEIETAKSPVPEIELSKSPVPQLEVFKSPIPSFEEAASPVPELEAFESVKSPIPEPEEAKSPVCELPASKSPVPVQEELTKTLVCDINAAKSPEPPLTPDFTTVEEIIKAEQHFEEICKSPPVTEDFTKPDEIQKAVEHFDEIFKAESPHEDVTSSLKDDASPIISPVPHDDSLQAEIPEVKTESIVVEAEINQVEQHRPVPDVLELEPQIHTLSAQAGEEIDIKTEKITPEFAEQAIVTPSEESKQDEVPTAPPAEELVQEPVIVAEKATEEQKETPEVGVVQAVAVAAGAAAVAAAAATVAVKSDKDEKKKPASPTKKPTAAKSATTKPPTKPATPKTASRLSASPKVAATKTSAAKTPTTATAPKPATPKASPRPKTATSTVPAAKSTEKKPLANGEVKHTARSSLTAKKTTSETTTTATKTSSSRPASATAARSSFTRPTTAPKPAPPKPTATGAVKTTTSRTSATTTATSKPRPNTLTARNATTTSSSATRTTIAATRTPPPKTSPRTATAPKPKAPTTASTTAAAPKPRVPLTKTISKAPDTEKQNKESANKLTASRTVTHTASRTATATARSSTTTVRRVVDSKVSATRTSKTTTTTMKSTTAKKPAEIVRNATTKTKTTTTKTEKPKLNGVATEFTATLTTTTTEVLNKSNAIEASSDQLLKDNSPVDNKLLVEGALIQTNTAD